MVHRTKCIVNILIPAMEGEKLEYTVILSAPESIGRAIIFKRIAFLAC